MMTILRRWIVVALVAFWTGAASANFDCAGCALCEPDNKYKCTECLERYLLNGDTFIPYAIMSTVCNKGCSTCGSDVANTDKCTKCLERYLLEGETCVPCPDKCIRCLDDNSCTLCDSPYFGSTYPHCNRTCPKNCNSSGCDAVTGYCFDCQPGLYGTLCDRKCDICKNGRCDRLACSEGCKLGYYHIAISATFSDCLRCKDNCAACSNFTHCTNCQTGFVSFRDDFDCLDCKHFIAGCKQCSYRSLQVVCDACQEGYRLEGNTCAVHTCPFGCSADCHSNETCIGGCKDGFAGERCDMFCNLQCKLCDQFDKNKCITKSCNFNYNSNCVILNGRETCNTTGFCLNGCLDGFWDIICNRSCSGGCIGSCDRMTGECYKCEHMRYGKFCDKNCSENCLNNDALKFNGLCTKNEGKCLQGCKPGFSGTFCTQATPIPTQEMITSTNTHGNVANKNVMVGAVVGALAGGILIGAGSVAVLCILKKRKRETASNRMPVYVNTPMNSIKSKSDPATSPDNIEGSTESSLYQQLSNPNTGNEYSVLSLKPSNLQPKESGAHLGYYNLSQ